MPAIPRVLTIVSALTLHTLTSRNILKRKLTHAVSRETTCDEAKHAVKRKSGYPEKKHNCLSKQEIENVSSRLPSRIFTTVCLERAGDRFFLPLWRKTCSLYLCSLVCEWLSG